MDVVNFDFLVNAERVLTYADINLQEDYIILGKHDPRRKDFKLTDYPVWAIPASEVFGYNEVRDENVPLPHRQIIDYVGAGVTATDDPINKKTVVTIPGGGASAGSTVVVKTTLDLNSTGVQTIIMPATGLYIITKAYVTNASVNMISDAAKELQLISASKTLTTKESGGGPGTPDLLQGLITPTNYIEMIDDDPTCFPPPCNSSNTVNGGVNLTAQLTTAFGSAVTADLYIVLTKLV